jgi:hypothetical protein
MSFERLVAETLAGPLPIVMVGSRADAVDPMVAVAEGLGMRIHRIDAAAYVTGSALDLPSRSTAPWLVVVDACDAVADGADDPLLDLAFDGDPTLPANAIVALCFEEPCELSDSLADDAIPCVLLSPDMRAPSIAEQVASKLGIPLIDVPLSKRPLDDFVGRQAA